VAPLSQAAETVTYYYTNEQGTPLATADASGNILTTSDYRPYGSQVLGSPAGGPGYTGHVNDPDSGLVYMQARYYDPVIGRFLASDPSPGDPGNPESFGRYTYASGNPVGNLDPDGRQTMPRDVYQIDWRNPQTQASVAESAAVAVAIPAVAYVAAAATAVAVDSLAAGSLTVGLTVNTEAVVTSGAIIADGAAAASGAPSGFSDEALVARGGAAANQTAEKIDAAIMPSRTPGVSGFSCQCDGGTNLATLGANIPNKQLGVTTVGAIRAVGGQVVATPGVGNHVTVTGLSGKQASPLMMIEKNPNPQPRP
jgi:RHS repeat-associated protein